MSQDSVLMRWNPDWVTGVDAIDSDHMEMLSRLETLVASVVAGVSAAEIEKTMVTLAQYIDGHFRREEQLMEQTSYPGLADHRAAHDALRNRFAFSIQHRAADSPSLTWELVDFLSYWLARHLDTHDRTMAVHLRANLPPSAV